MSSSASKLHHCPHECGCTYASKRLSHVTRHTGAGHGACNPGCPIYDQAVTLDSVATKQVERRNRPAVQERNERPTVQGPTVPIPKPRSSRPGHAVSIFDEELYYPSGSDSNNEGSDPNDTDPPLSHTKPERIMPGLSKNPYGRGRIISNREAANMEANRAALSHAPILAKARDTRSVFDPPHRRTTQKATLRPSSRKQAPTSSWPTILTPTRSAAPAKSTPLSTGLTGEPSITAQKQPSPPQLAPPSTTSTPLNAQPFPVDPPNQTKPRHPNKVASQPIGAVLEQPAGLVDVISNPGPDNVAPGDPSPSPEPEPSQNGTPRRPPTKSPPTQSAQNSPESTIESLYASPSPEKTVTDIVPLELDSDPDFEMMERMLISHRGPLSQSQLIKMEPTNQPSALSQAERPLKRQRSHSSPNKSSQAPTRIPQADRSAKRPRVNESHTPNSPVVLNDRRKHPEFWDLDGTVILQVDDVLFRVMRSTLSKASPWFQHLFSEGLDHLEIMAGCPVYTIEEDFSYLDFANLLRGLEKGLEYALNKPHYLRIASIFRAASLLEFDTLRRWSLGCLEKQWPADLPPPSKPSKFGSKIPWAEETLAIAEQFDVPQLIKRAYWELCTRPEFRSVDAEVYDDEAEEIMLTRPRLLRTVLVNLTRLRERLLPEWTRITRTPPIDIPCPRATKTPSTFASQPIPCSLDYANWHRIISRVEVNDMTIDDRRMDPISALEIMITEINWEKEGGFCTDCVNMWRVIWTKDREKIWRNLGDWLGMDVDTGL